jgi:tyrosyl-tRNA synthetase
MLNATSTLLRTLDTRGYIHQCTNPAGLDELAQAGPVTGYIGFDATASSLHVGSLVQIMMLRRLQQAGGKPIVLMGGGTTKVGDPSGKDESRKLLDDTQINANIASIQTVFEKFLTFGNGPTDAVLINNADWLDKLEYIPFLRDIGRHFTINRMLAMDSVKLRLEREQPLTFLEFNYMLLQGYDYFELYNRTGCRLQMGGSDQWGNILQGADLVRRLKSVEAFGLTTPLITTASGGKMGKTADGAVWLDAALLSPYDYWQFWRNVDDADVGRFLKLFTDLSLEEIAKLEALAGAEINDAKKVLADAATAMLHGADEAAKARAGADAAFAGGGSAADMPTLMVDGVRLNAGITLADLAVETGLAASKGEARRLAQGGGLRVNDTAIVDANTPVTAADLRDGAVKLSAGKKKHVLVQPA